MSFAGNDCNSIAVAIVNCSRCHCELTNLQVFPCSGCNSVLCETCQYANHMSFACYICFDSTYCSDDCLQNNSVRCFVCERHACSNCVCLGNNGTSATGSGRCSRKVVHCTECCHGNSSATF